MSDIHLETARRWRKYSAFPPSLPAFDFTAIGNLIGKRAALCTSVIAFAARAFHFSVFPGFD